MRRLRLTRVRGVPLPSEALSLGVFVVVIVSLRRLVGDVPTWLGVVLMGTVYTLAFTIRAGSHSEPSNT